jgi:hypothetical protein
LLIISNTAGVRAVTTPHVFTMRFSSKVTMENAPWWRSSFAGWRTTGRVASPKDPVRIAPKHAAILVTRAAEKMIDEQRQLLDRIKAKCPDVIALRQLALGFRSALTSGESIKMRRWIEGAKRCEFGSVVRFAYKRISPPSTPPWIHHGAMVRWRAKSID